MRAAALLGLGSVARSVATFQRLTGAEWTSLIEQADVAVIFGGDGTVHRHLAELVELEIPVLVVPCGSGNDFARALKIRSVKDAARAFGNFARSGKSDAIDLGVITPDGLKLAGRGPSVGTAEAVPFPPMSAHAFRRTYSTGMDKTEPLRTAGALRTTDESAVAVMSPEAGPDRESPQTTPEFAQQHFCCVAGVGIDAEIARRANALPKWIRARG